MTNIEPASGDRVRVIGGRWHGREGRLIGYSIVQSGQVRIYPSVELYPAGRARARKVRVMTIERVGR